MNKANIPPPPPPRRINDKALKERKKAMNKAEKMRRDADDIGTDVNVSVIL